MGSVLSSVPWQDTDSLSPVCIQYQASHTERQLAGPPTPSQIPGEESLESSVAGGGAGSHRWGTALWCRVRFTEKGIVGCPVGLISSFG